MKIDKKLKDKIAALAADTPDPARAESNFLRLIEEITSLPKSADLPLVARLMAQSQFLANWTSRFHQELIGALSDIDSPVTASYLTKRIKGDPAARSADEDTASRALRRLKRRYILQITLRYLSGRSDMALCMGELSALADCLIEAALALAIEMNGAVYGQPKGGTKLAIIGLGKLGGGELNYSSDVDLIAVYGTEEGQTSGVIGTNRLRTNRITAHEYYVKVTESMTRLLSENTFEGIAYRVDFRLRPEGEKGELALPLAAYKSYYETWARTWERMALIRARQVAGDPGVGKAYMKIAAPFLWRRSVDYSELEEIRALKKKIDARFLKDDIKRGYGGIREAEFFVQTFQLLFGGEHESLRTCSLSEAIRALRTLGFVPEDELDTLWKSYLFFREVEQYIQMKDDLQTYSIPQAEHELLPLARSMGFRGIEDFSAALRIKRMNVRGMYNTLLGTKEDKAGEALSLIEGELGDEELGGYLMLRGFIRHDEGLRNLKHIREQINQPMSTGARELVRRVVPGLVDRALSAESPDRALSGIDGFLTSLGINESYLAAFTEEKILMRGMMSLFSLSPELTRVFLSHPFYIGELIEDMPIRRSYQKTVEKLGVYLRRERDMAQALASFKQAEEIRLIMLFAMRVMPAEALMRYLSHLAEVIVRAGCDKYRGSLGVIALGKLGGREITYGSDLDLVFVSDSPSASHKAERLINLITSYTRMGNAYMIDTRLRPDGTKGTLVKSIEGYREYYYGHAGKWEIQALLKARPIAGDPSLCARFMDMARDAIMERAGTIGRSDVEDMRGRIEHEFSHEREGMDIRVGPGGIKELEFHVQWLMLHHARAHPHTLVQGTVPAIRRLMHAGGLSAHDGKALLDAYSYLRRIETVLRVNGESFVPHDGEINIIGARFMDHRNVGEFLDAVRGHREKVLSITRGQGARTKPRENKRRGKP